MLTKKALELIKDTQAKSIASMESADQFLKSKQTCYWEKATPDTTEGIEAFSLFNYFRDRRRSNSAKLKQLRLAQKEVKAAIAYHVEWARYVNETTKYEGKTK